MTSEFLALVELRKAHCHQVLGNDQAATILRIRERIDSSPTDRSPWGRARHREGFGLGERLGLRELGLRGLRAIATLAIIYAQAWR